MRSLLRQEDYSQAWVKDFYSQAAVWWGQDPQAAGVHQARVETVARLCGGGCMTILDLGTGPGATAAALADAGHHVLAVELSPARARFARDLATVPRRGSLAVLEADFYEMELKDRFEVVCCWETFGLGTDADQRRLLRRIAQEWLAPGGSVLMDVYNPAGPARDSGKEWRLAPLPGVPGSVEMLERCHYDPVQGRWIDEWQPTANPEHALAQTLRCYTPADLVLLLEGTGLRLKLIEIQGEAIDVTANRRMTSASWFARDYNYLVQLVPG